MKNIYKLIAIVLFAFTATLNAQLINSDGTKNDEFLGKQKQPVVNNGCECVNSDIDNFNFTFSNNLFYAMANDRAVIEASKREAWDWYNHQTDLMKDYIGAKNNKTFNSYNEAKDFIFRETEKDYIRSNAPIARQKISSARTTASHARNSGLKGLKALLRREREINSGKLDNSIYADLKVNNIPLKDIRTLSHLNSIRATVKTTTINGLWQTDQFSSMLDEINTMISNTAYTGLENLAFNKKNGFYNGFNPWDRLNMMQLQVYFQQQNNLVSYPHFLSGGVFEKFYNKIEVATADFIEDEIKKSYTEYDLFHNEHWRIILRDKYNNSPIHQATAIAEHKALKEAELNRLRNQTPLGASLDVDKIVDQLNITDQYEYQWINANKDKATEFLNRLREAKKKDEEENANPIPDNQIISIVGNNYESEIANINNEFAVGAQIAKLIEELQITDETKKSWFYENTNHSLDLIKFMKNNPNFVYNKTLSNGEAKKVNSIQELENYLNSISESIKNITLNNPNPVLSTYQYQYDTPFFPLYMNLDVKSELDNPTTSVNEFKLLQVDASLSGFTALLELEQGQHAIQPHFDETRVTIVKKTRMKFGIDIFDLNFVVTEQHIIYAVLEITTGGAFSIRVVEKP